LTSPMIQLKGVRYCYGEVCAIEGMDVSITPNTLAALIGPNGGGKSTMIKLIAGLLRPEAGQVLVGGRGVGYVSQAPDFDLSFPATVREVVRMGTLSARVRPFARYTAAQKRAADEAMERVGITDVAHRGISQLSGGQLRRAMIARALASGSDVIVLDEPDAGLDIDAAAELYSVLGTLKADKTILAASHHVDAILDIADTALYVLKTARAYRPDDLRQKLKAGLRI